MQLKHICCTVVVLVSLFTYSQETNYNAFNINNELKENANAVVRLYDIVVDIQSSKKMTITQKRVVTVLNSSGDSKVNAYFFYDGSYNVKTLQAKIYDQFGQQIKKIKKNDFKDVAAVDGVSLYTDNRIKYLDYTPINYPYTVEFDLVYDSSFTAGIPAWYPVEEYYVSTEKSSYTILNPTEIEVSIRKNNLKEFNIENISDQKFIARNISALKSESYSPAFIKFAPSVKLALKEFHIKGVIGTNSNWMEFGKWMNEELLKGTQSLPEDTINEIRELTLNESSEIEKAKIVYDYVQNKTRYISVQVGIGGWKPMLASDVDRLGYGDCKGLSNYTKALLDAVGVKSYYTIIYGDNDIRNIDDSFSSLQGNHAILCIPQETGNIWLECTSQTNPFGYIANFTDDRDALVITPEGGKIQHTKVYDTEENILKTTANISVNSDGGFEAEVKLKSSGTQYHYRERVTRKDHKDQDLFYKNYWSYLNTLKIDEFNFESDKENIEFNEAIKLSVKKYASNAGDRLLLQVNFFNRIEDAPNRFSSRKLPFEVERGFIDVDEYQISIPEDFEIEAMMKPINISNRFGEYSASIDDVNGTLFYNRKFQLNKGYYQKEDYEKFREFWIEIIKHDKSKIVLKAKN